MKKISRKQFLSTGLLAGGSLLIPRFLMGSQSLLSSSSHRKLVVIQLSGGNDGLNTFIPYRNDLYFSNRPALSYAKNEILTLTSEMGLNPVMKGFKGMYDNGDVCIINSVGYPNPDRSHFRSMDIWHTASGSEEYLNTGWIGRYLDAVCKSCDNAHLALEADDMLGLALKGSLVKGMAIKDPERLYRAVQDPFFKELNKTGGSLDHHHETASYLYKTAQETASSIGYIYDKTKKGITASGFPDDDFGNKLQMVAGLIASDCETQIYYVSLNGFDTHARQKQVHERLLETYSSGMSAFVAELKKQNRFQDTLIMTFSEFGRRVKENGSGGTDHGAGNNMVLMGGGLKKKGLYNDAPDLQNLLSGDIAHKVDFRNVYGTILEKWLDTDPTQLISGKIKPESFI